MTGEPSTSSDGLPARRVAFLVLNAIVLRGRSMDESFAQAEPELARLPARDRAFVRVLVATVLRRARQIDAVLETLLHEPAATLKPAALLNILRLGAAQMAFLDTPAHAAVNTSVELAGDAGMTRQKTLVNAIMRRLSREGFPRSDARDEGRQNLPDWLWQTWVRDYGDETALDMAAAVLTDAPVDFTVRRDAEGWAEKLEALVLPTGSLRKTESGFIPGLAGFVEGAWWVQNAAAALPARVFGDVRGKTVVDLCAAPGGKTAQLAAAGARVTALDRSEARMGRLRENMARLGLEVETVVADGAAWRPEAPVDAILLDAPCTATGTIRHQPDVLHLKTPQDQEKLVALQRRLIVNAARMLRTGGQMVYCTCSLQKDEGERQTDWILAGNAPFRLSPILAGEVAGTEDLLTERGEIRALPCHWADIGGLDGFYVARFERT